MTTVICRSHTTMREPNRESHLGIAGFADAIREAPADITNWLILADWLEEQSLPLHAQTIRALFGVCEPPALPEGKEIRVSRSGTYYENGGRHYEGITVTLRGPDRYDANGKDVHWTHDYWSNGNWRQHVTREDAVKLLTSWKPRHSSGSGLSIGE